MSHVNEPTAAPTPSPPKSSLPKSTLTTEQPAVERLFQRMCEVTDAPRFMFDVVKAVRRDPDCQQEMREILRYDPALVAQIVRRVNSPYYGLSTRVTDIGAAIELVGCREIRNLAVTIALCRLYTETGNIGSFSRFGLLNHSVAVGAASHLVARVCGVTMPSDAYLCGVLHDLGFILLDLHMRRRFGQMVGMLNAVQPVRVLENRTYGFDHAQLGAYVARCWELGESVASAIRYHDRAADCDDEHRPLACVVNVADYLCSRAGWTSLGVHNVPPPDDETLGELGIDTLALSIVWKELVPTLEKSMSLTTNQFQF